MKIKCQEHYDKVAEYAKSIGDTTFQNCIERLKQWEKNSGGRYEIELITISLRIHSDLRKGHRMEETALWVDCSITADRMSLLP